MNQAPLRLKPWKVNGMVPQSTTPFSPIVDRAAHSWAGQPLRGKDRGDWPLLWTLPAAARLSGYTGEADYLAHSFKNVLFDPKFGRAGYPVLRPRAVVVQANRGVGAASDTIFAALRTLQDVLAKNHILVLDDPSMFATGPDVIGMGLPPETTFETVDANPLGGTLRIPACTVDGGKWTAGQVLYLTFPSTMGSVGYANVAAQDILTVPPGGGLVDNWTIQFYTATNALNADLARVTAGKPCYERVRWYVGVFDQGERNLGRNLDGSNQYTTGWDAFYKSVYQSACAAAGPEHVYEALGPYTDGLLMATALRVVKDFFHLT